MAGMAEDIFKIFAAQHLGGFITALPRGQVIVEGAGHKRIHCNITQVNGRIKHLQLAWMRQFVVHKNIQELAMECTGQIGAVGIPGEDVEAWRLSAQ